MFIYLTGKRFPASTADHFYIRNLAAAFSNVLGNSFRLVIAGKKSDDLATIPSVEVPAPPFLRSLFYFVWFPWFISTLGKSEKRHVIFSNDFNLLAIAILWKNLIRSYDVCSDWHLLSETWKDRFAIRGSQILITTSQRLKDVLIHLESTAQGRTHVVYGGVDAVTYQKPMPTRQGLGLLEQGYLVGYVGLFKTMGKDKGLRTMIQALQYLEEDVRMVFVGGSTEETREYISYAKQEGVKDRCVFISRQPSEKVSSYQRAMDVLVIPYPNQKHFSEYGFPMKVYEYLAAEKPIIYSDLPIIGEVLADKGSSFKPEDAFSLAEVIKDTRKKEAVPRYVSIEQFSWKSKAKTISELLSLIPSTGSEGNGL